MRPKTFTFALTVLLTLLGFGWAPARADSFRPGLFPQPRLDADALQWQAISTGLESPFALWFSPDYAASGRLWAAMDHGLQEVGYGYGAVYSSADRGASWQMRSPVSRNLRLAAFASSDGGDPLILALEAYFDAASQPAYRLVRSADGGASWQTVWDGCPPLSSLVFSPNFAGDHTVFAVWDNTAAGGLWKSADGGVTWQPNQRIQVAPTHGHIVSLVFSPAYADDDTLLASAPPHFADGATYGGGLYRSQDRGVTWAEMARNGCVSTDVRKLVIAPNPGATYSVYALGESSIYRSGDGGVTWNCPALEPKAGAHLDMALSPDFTADRTLLVATGRGLSGSTDGGATWSPLGWAGTPVQRVRLSPTYTQDRTLAVALLDGDVDAAGTPYPGGTFLSRDGGATWQPAGVARMAVRSLALSPDFANDQRVWAASGDGSWAAYRSADAGQSWLRQPYYNVSAWSGFSGLAAAPASGGQPLLFAVTPIGGTSAGVYKSGDNGATFALLPGSPQFGSAVVVAMTATGDRSVWVGSYQGVHRSLNDGANWALRNGDLPAGAVVSLAVAPGANTPETHTLFAVLTGAQGGVYRTTDSGGHWTKLALPGGTVARHVSLAPEYAADATLWVATAAHGLLRSSDGGETWQTPATLLSNCGPVQVTGESPGRQLWAACEGKLVTSADGGVHWAAAGPSGVVVASVATSPLSKTVFVGTENGGGIWRGRPDTSTVVVLDEAGAPVAGAEVYRNGTLAGRTSDSGIVETPLSAGDQLVARKLLATEASTRAYHNPGGGASWIYRLYITSLAIPAAGEPAPAPVSNPQKVQYLTVRKDNTLIGFNLVASVEWDASAQFLEELRQGFALASRELYDASNGQMLFERVSIYDDGVAMASADVQVRASNQAWPHAYLSGLRVQPPRVAGNHFWTGPYFNGYGSSAGAWTERPAYSMLVHEFGHYGLALYDSYFYYSVFGAKWVANCTGPEIKTNQTLDTNATLMDCTYNATEFAMRGVPGAWTDLCLDTAQLQRNGQSDWQTIVSVYQRAAPQWRLKTPADYGQVVAGPHAIPVARWSRVEIAADAQTGVCPTPPTIQVRDTEGAPVPGTGVSLQHGSRLVDLGSTDHDGKITLLGARQGDLAIYEVYLPQIGAAGATPASLFWGPRFIVKEAVVCPTGQALAAEDSEHLAATAPVVVQPAAYDLRVEIAPSNPPTSQQAALQVKASTPLASPPAVTWMQVGAEDAVTPPLSYDPAAQAYVGSLPLAPALPMQGVLLADAVDVEQQKVHTVVNVHLETVTPAADQRIFSVDGQAELFIPAGFLQGEGQISWQAQWLYGPAPAELDPIAGPYDLRISPGLTQLNASADIDAASLSLYYVERSASGEHIDLDSLQIFTWDGQQWTSLETTVVDAGKLASASIPLRNGTFALFGRWQSQSQLFLPLLRQK